MWQGMASASTTHDRIAAVARSIVLQLKQEKFRCVKSEVEEEECEVCKMCEMCEMCEMREICEMYECMCVCACVLVPPVSHQSGGRRPQSR